MGGKNKTLLRVIETLIGNPCKFTKRQSFFPLKVVPGSRKPRLLGLQRAQHCATAGVEHHFSHMA